MRKINLILLLALTFAVLAGLSLHQVSNVSAQGETSMGVVVAYTPGVSITIVDQNGNQVEYALDANVKIESSSSEKFITVGSVVTIVAPASLDKGKQKVVAIMVHPEKELLPSETPRVKNTALPTDVLVTKTPKIGETPTLVGDLTTTPSATPIVSENAKQEETGVKANPFIEWLRSLFQQVLTQQ
jgi:hypothetical protein